MSGDQRIKPDRNVDTGKPYWRVGFRMAKWSALSWPISLFANACDIGDHGLGTILSAQNCLQFVDHFADDLQFRSIPKCRANEFTKSESSTTKSRPDGVSSCSFAEANDCKSLGVVRVQHPMFGQFESLRARNFTSKLA